MKTLKHFLFSLVVAVVASLGMAHLEAMKRAEPDSGFKVTESAESVDSDRTLRPIGIIIHPHEECPMDTQLKMDTQLNILLTDARSCLSQEKPIIMVSPATLSKLEQEHPRFWSDKLLLDFWFLDTNDSHFITMVPGIYKEYLEKYQTCQITNHDQLTNLLAKKK